MILAFALLPFELAFWIGFSLPFGPVLGAARTALLAAAWLAAPRVPQEPRAPAAGPG